jgi:putative membrane protein
MIFLQIILAVISGVVAGTFTGLMPGIHINFVAMTLLIFSKYFLSYFQPLTLAVFIVSMAIAHSFLDFVPSIFLSAPNSETALSIMPGHKLLLKGNGYAAVRLSITGCYIGMIILIITTPLLMIAMPFIYGSIKNSMGLILIAAVLFLMINEKKRFWAFFIFLLSGALGLITLELPIKEPLFPLLTGLFGASMIITSISEKTELPEQKITCIKLDKKEYAKISSSGLIASSLCSFLPGLGASQAAVIASDINGRMNSRTFLVLLGIISTLVTGLNFVAIYAINKPRSGVAVVASKILETTDNYHLAVLLAAALISAGIAFVLSLCFAKIFARYISRINYTKISLGILGILVAMTFFVSGIIGSIVLITATFIGLFAISKGIRKMHLMGCLMLPVILYFI